MFGEVGHIIGQVLGAVAVVLGFVTFQMKNTKGILAVQVVTALVFSAHYLLIGALTAAGLNFLAAIQCLCYYFRNKRGSKNLVVPILFTVLVVVTSILTWDAWYSSFIMVGLVINSIALTFADAQKIRYAMFIKSPCCLVYNVLAGSGGGTVYECASLISSVIGIVKNARKDKENGEV